MKTMTITVTTNHTNMDHEYHSEHRSNSEALAYLIGFINASAEHNMHPIKKVEVK